MTLTEPQRAVLDEVSAYGPHGFRIGGMQRLWRDECKLAFFDVVAERYIALDEDLAWRLTDAGKLVVSKPAGNS